MANRLRSWRPDHCWTMASSNSSSLIDDSSEGIPQRYLLSQIVVGPLLAIPAVLSNLILLITIYRGQLPRTSVTLLIINLSVCDLLFGLIPGFGSIYYDINLFIDRKREKLLAARLTIIIAAVITNIVSSCTIAAMAFDRLFAVSVPLQYRTLVSKKRIKVCIAVFWVYAVFFASLAHVVSTTVFVLMYVHLHVTLPLIVLPLIYWKAYHALRSHNSQVRNFSNTRDTEQMSLAHRSRERKMISAFLIVLVLFYTTFAPQYIAQNILVAQPSLSKIESFIFFLYASNKFLLVNSFLNPFIYAWRIAQYKKAFQEVFGGFICSRQNSRVYQVAESSKPSQSSSELWTESNCWFKRITAAKTFSWYVPFLEQNGSCSWYILFTVPFMELKDSSI